MITVSTPEVDDRHPIHHGTKTRTDFNILREVAFEDFGDRVKARCNITANSKIDHTTSR